ncbi:hypothetical protein 44RRORF163w [Aeromonas phage 44RR2.8t]|uniref:Sf6-type phage tail needle knob domain-containing protein n=2 Tax=Biquartavirus 44RR2 TaxID=115987 RepID=Q6U9D9_9CAUD|nr:hypothetical protein ST44RRORF163w [Aeromonas phage 44RR2.8t]AAQ81481.1 hypothetical protein 44RRORF163w [Aeromonas phage 44RR2.8t]APU00635.1 hypothetical protein [Aeromonas phage 44RR2.8t.2]
MILNPKAVLNNTSSGSSGVSSFNGRIGPVDPESGDYTADMVNAIEKAPTDSQRRVLIGTTPTVEELIDPITVVDNLTSDSSTSALSAKQGKLLQDGKQPTITGAASTIASVDLTPVRIAATDSNGKMTTSLVSVSDLDLIKDRTTRVKSELEWTGLNIDVTGTALNLVGALKAITPVYGSWAPMFDIINDKMVAAKNDDRTLLYKIAITGTFDNTSSTNALTLTTTIGSNIDVSSAVRLPNQNPQNINYISLISVDKNGNFATNGASLTLRSTTSDFTITRVRLIAEQ